MPRQKHFPSLLLAIGLLFSSSTSPAIGPCPHIKLSHSCSALISIKPDGSLGIQKDLSVVPIDGEDDALVGVINSSGATVFGITLSGKNIFAFDGDGPIEPFGTYAGPGTSFSKINANTGTVNFTNGLDDGKFLWFAVDDVPSQVKLTGTITIDPGHGYDCAQVKQPTGAIGVTDFPATTPPSGRLREDDLALRISQKLESQLQAAGYKVFLTKTDVSSCPTYLERTAIANDSRSNMFISVHINAPSSFPLGLFSGSSALYNSRKSDAKALAEMVSEGVSSSIGVSNRGSSPRDDLAVLKPTSSRMAAIIIEVARLSGPDEIILHNAATPVRAAAGIASGIDRFINR